MESGNRLGRTFLPLPSLPSMESISDRSGPLDPSKPPLPPPQSTMARGLPINPSFPTRPTSGYHFPVSKSYKHLICTHTTPQPPNPNPASAPPVPHAFHTRLDSRRQETSDNRCITNQSETNKQTTIVAPPTCSFHPFLSHPLLCFQLRCSSVALPPLLRLGARLSFLHLGSGPQDHL